LVCYESLARSVPTNYILLACFTLCESYMVAAMTAFIEPMIVIEAASLTCVITVAITIFAMTTDFDATEWGAGVYCCLFVPVMLCQFIMFMIFGANS
jgi:FtsH-binding integral membrane protein